MHVQCCDITYDVTVSFSDITLANKMTCFGRTVSKVCPPKIAQNSHRKTRVMWQWYTQNAGCSTQCHTLPHIFGCIPMTGAYNHFIYLYYYNYNEFYNKSSNVFMRISSTAMRGLPAGLSSEVVQLFLINVHLDVYLLQWQQVIHQ